MHTLGPSCVHAARWASHVLVHQAPCRKPPSAVSWPSSQSCRSAHRLCPRSCHTLCPAPTRAAARHVTASLAVSRASRLYRGACPAVSQHCIATQPAARPSSCHDTNDCIVTHPTSQASLLSQYNRLYRDTPQRPGRSPVTIQLIVLQHTLPARPRACELPHALARDRLCRGPSWSCRGPVWLYRGASPTCCAAPPGLVSQYTPLYRDSTQANGQ